MRDFLFGVFSALGAASIAIVVWGTITGIEQAFKPPLPPSLVSHPSLSVDISSSIATSPKTVISEPVVTISSSFPEKSVMTTLFWVGEGETSANGFISNVPSYWDEYWMSSFGGLDDPDDRCGYHPCDFTPKENPFYIALPYVEFNQNGTALKPSAFEIPWYGKDDQQLLKNRWVEVSYKDKTCYGQWQDVGPYLTDDFVYVFEDAKPSNTFGVKAGLDVSPALWDCLGLKTNDVTTWKFVEAKNVPDGPWKEIITTSGISWSN